MNRLSRLDYEPLSGVPQVNLIDFLQDGRPHALAGSRRRDWNPCRMAARREFCAKCRDERNPNRCFMSLAHAQQRAIRLLTASGGFSVNATGQSPAWGYMVSVYGAEQTIPLQPNLSPFVATYFQSHLLASAEYWGGWIDDDKLVLDVSLNVCSREDAILLGQIFQQRAIYDIAARQVVELTPAPNDNSAHAGHETFSVKSTQAAASMMRRLRMTLMSASNHCRFGILLGDASAASRGGPHGRIDDVVTPTRPCGSSPSRFFSRIDRPCSTSSGSARSQRPGADGGEAECAPRLGHPRT